MPEKKKKSNQGKQAQAAQLKTVGAEQMKARAEALNAVASQMRLVFRDDLERLGNDPVAQIGVIARALGVDALRACDPAIDIDDLLRTKR